MVEAMNSDRRVAFHEAGHAVMAHYLGRTIERICVTGKDGVRGYTSEGAEGAVPEGMNQDELIRWCWQGDVLFTVAGAVAEKIEFGDYDPEAAEYDERDLVQDVRGSLEQMRDRAWHVAEGILRQRWAAVELLAARLVSPPTTLSRFIAEAIIYEALGASEMDELFAAPVAAPAPRLPS